MQTLHKKMGRGTRILQKARKDGRGCSWCCDCCFDGDQWSFCLCGLRVQRRRELSRADSAAPRRGSRTQLEAHLLPRPTLLTKPKTPATPVLVYANRNLRNKNK